MEYESLTRTTPPAVEPVTLADAKQHLRVDTDADDSYIVGLIAAAREWCEAYLDRTLIHTQWTMRLENFPADEIELPRPPMATAAGFTDVSVVHTLSDGTTATLATNQYRVDRNSTPGELYPLYAGTWPADRREDENAVAVTWWAGYGPGPADVPATIRHAMLMLVGHWYDGARQAAVSSGAVPQDVPFGVRSLLDTQRHYR